MRETWSSTAEEKGAGAYDRNGDGLLTVSAPADANQSELRSTFSSTTGGVLTEEVGAITGDLEVATVLQQGSLAARVRYAGAGEWYTVSGSPVQVERFSEPDPSEPDPSEPDSHRTLHDQALEALTQPGSVSWGNEQPVDIRRRGSESL